MASASVKPAPRSRQPRPGRVAFVWYLAAGAAISAVFVLPLLWEVLRSLQPESAVSTPPSAATFGHLTFANYRALLSGQDDIIRNVTNSLIVGVLTAVLTSLVACWLATGSRSSGSAGQASSLAWCCWPS